MVQERKLTSLRLLTPLYEYLQEQAKKQNRSVNNYIETVLLESWKKEPNEETLKAIDEAVNHPEKLEEITNIRSFLENVRDGKI